MSAEQLFYFFVGAPVIIGLAVLAVDMAVNSVVWLFNSLWRMLH